MYRKKKLSWGIKGFALVFIGVLATTYYVEREANNQENFLFSNQAPLLISLDEKTFSNEMLFERSTLLSAKHINHQMTLRQFSRPLSALTSTVHGYHLFMAEGFNLIHISNKKDKVYALQTYLKSSSPIEAISAHPFDQNKIFLLTGEHKLYLTELLSEKNIKTIELGFVKALPKNMKAQEMWSNPITKKLLIVATNETDSLIVEIDPLNSLKFSKELALPNKNIVGGLALSKQIMLLIDSKYQLNILDWEKQTLLGHFKPNQNFKDQGIFQKPAKGIALARNKLYIIGQDQHLMQLAWKASNQVIVLNRDVEIKKGNVVIHWKMPKQKSKALYLAELSLPALPQKNKSKKLASPAAKSPQAFGPLKKNKLEIPYIQTASQSFDLKLLAIKKRNGQVISPTYSFTIDTQNLEQQ